MSLKNVRGENTVYSRVRGGEKQRSMGQWTEDIQWTECRVSCVEFMRKTENKLKTQTKGNREEADSDANLI